MYLFHPVSPTTIVTPVHPTGVNMLQSLTARQSFLEIFSFLSWFKWRNQFIHTWVTKGEFSAIETASIRLGSESIACQISLYNIVAEQFARCLVTMEERMLS